VQRRARVARHLAGTGLAPSGTGKFASVGGTLVIGSFVLGMIVGGAAVWVWGEQMREYIDDKTWAVRARAADGLGAAADTLQTAKETIESGFSGPAPETGGRETAA
jgi:hypothetical protein